MSPVAPARFRMLASRRAILRGSLRHVEMQKADPERPAPHWMIKLARWERSRRRHSEAAPHISARAEPVPVLPGAAPASRLPCDGGAQLPRLIEDRVSTSRYARPLGRQATRRRASGIGRSTSPETDKGCRSGSEPRSGETTAPDAGSCPNWPGVRGCRWISDQSPPLPLLRRCFVLVFT
jgi:hypothetical protein